MACRETSAPADKLLTETELAEYLNVSVAAVRRWRYENRGPEYLKVGGTSVRYRRDAVDRWLDSTNRVIASDEMTTLRRVA